jgi:hypothetical protein
MKLFLLPLLAAVFCSPYAAQETCSLTLKDAPTLQNLRLGMPPEEVQTVFGRALKIKIKKKGWRVFFQNYIENPAPPVLSGVRALYLRFFEGRLYQIEIFYENRPEIKTIEDFENYLETTLKLPDLWRDERGRQTIRCVDFSLFADKILNPRVELTDETTRARADEFLLEQQNKK